MTTRVKHKYHGFHECTPFDLQMFLDAGYEVVKDVVNVAKELSEEFVNQFTTETADEEFVYKKEEPVYKEVYKKAKKELPKK